EELGVRDALRQIVRLERSVLVREREQRVDVEAGFVVEAAGQVRDGHDPRALRRELVRCDPADVAEALYDAALLREPALETMTCAFYDHHYPGSGRFVPEERPAERNGLARDEHGHRLAPLHR